MSAMDLDVSLADRISAQRVSTRGSGQRGKRGKATGRVVSNGSRPSPRSTPYSRPPSSAPDGQWNHSGFLEQNQIKGGPLAARMLAKPRNGNSDEDNSQDRSMKAGAWTHDKFPGGGGKGGRKGANNAAGAALAKNALAALGGGSAGKSRGLSMKGAGSSAMVEVRNLVPGTTSEDVAAIFADSGKILTHHEVPVSESKDPNSVTVRVKFESQKQAEAAKAAYDGQHADGRTLSVKIIASQTLLDTALKNGITPRQDADLLPDSSSSFGGMRSDELLTTRGAHIVTDPTNASSSNHRGGTRAW